MAAAAYRAGEKLHSEYYGEDSDYTRKGGVICSEILLPSHAPPEYADRETLWNAVEKAERGKKAQLACSFDISQGSLRTGAGADRKPPQENESGNHADILRTCEMRRLRLVHELRHE